MAVGSLTTRVSTFSAASCQPDDAFQRVLVQLSEMHDAKISHLEAEITRLQDERGSPLTLAATHSKSAGGLNMVQDSEQQFKLRSKSKEDMAPMPEDDFAVQVSTTDQPRECAPENKGTTPLTQGAISRTQSKTSIASEQKVRIHIPERESTHSDDSDVLWQSTRSDQTTRSRVSLRSVVAQANSILSDHFDHVDHLSANQRAKELRKSTIKNLPLGAASASNSCELWRPVAFEDTGKTRIRTIVEHPFFDGIFAVLILMNALIMCAEVQYNGIEVGYTLQYRGSARSAVDAWPSAEIVFDVCDMILGTIFIIEVCMKMVAWSYEFFCSMWNVLDLMIVLSFLAEKVSHSFLPMNTKSVRLFRLARLMRLVRLIKTLEGFDALFLLSTALRSSASVLAWALLLLLWLQSTIALLVSQLLIAMYLEDETQPIAARRDVYAYFGTFSRALLSLFEMTLANWPPICRLLSENVTEWFVPFCLVHKLLIGFAVVSVINGVLMQETFKVAGADDNIMVRQRRQAMDAHKMKMRALFDLLDTDNNGQVSMKEFEMIAESEIAQTWLNAMEIETDDLDTLFMLIDSQHCGYITVDELIKGVSRVQGHARSIDVMKIINAQVRAGGSSCVRPSVCSDQDKRDFRNCDERAAISSPRSNDTLFLEDALHQSCASI